MSDLNLLYYIFIFPLEQILDWALFTIFKATKNYGISIILLSLLVNLFLLKLFIYTDKKAKDEAELKENLDKRIKSWKKVYSKAKLYAFTQTLYRQHNYHPIYALRSLGGLLLQIPFFFAMYGIIQSATYLENVRFLWIDDLSKPDSIMLFKYQLHILPLLMTLFTLINVFYSQKELSARIQGIIITLAFLFLLYDMPSSLVLYWTCNMLFALLKEVWKHRLQNENKILKNTNQTINKFDFHDSDINSKLVDIKNNNALAIKNDRSNDRKTSLFKRIFTLYNNGEDLRQGQYKIIQYAIISLTFMICVSSPYALYVTDLGNFELKTILPTLAVLFGFFIIIAFSLLYIISFIKKENKFCIIILYILAWICLALTMLGTCYNFILRGDYGVMSDFFFEKGIEIDKTHAFIDGIMIAVCFIASLCLLKLKKYIILAYKILLVILVANSLLSLYTALSYIFTLENTRSEYAKNQNPKDNKSQKSQLLDFAKHKKNILVLLLDRSDGYVMHEIFKEYPHLKDSFNGFIDFTNAISSGGNTLPTLTSVIAGEYYTAANINSRNITDGLQSEIARGYAGILNTFNENGYVVSALLDFPTDEAHLYPLLNNTKGILFDTTFLKNDYVKHYLAGGYADKKLPIAQLISYVLFRNATFVIRRGIYRSGMWLFNEHGIISMSSLMAIAELSALAEETTANATKPTFKFIHNSITHNPYGSNSACQINPKEIASPQDDIYELPKGHYNSEKCAWIWVSKMLKRLQDLGVYDNTEIFITADHGAQSKFMPIHYNLHIPLLYKPINAKGEMRKDSRVILNYDIPRLFCANIKQKCPNVTPTTLDLLKHTKPIQAVKVNGWNIKDQNKNSYKINTFYTFRGRNIYDANSWQINNTNKDFITQQDTTKKDNK